MAFDPVGLRATWTTTIQDWDVYEDRKILSIGKREPWVQEDFAQFVLKLGPGRDFREQFQEGMDMNCDAVYPDLVRAWVISRIGCLSEL